MQLRPYQQEAVERVFEEWKTAKSTLIVLPTGCGKTLCMAEIARRVYVEQNQRVMLLAHREELIFQAQDKIHKVSGLDVQVEMGAYRTQPGLFEAPPVIVSTIQTHTAGNDGGGRMTKFDPSQFGLLLVDECVTGDTLVTLADGTQETIKNIVDNNCKVMVRSYNESTKSIQNELVYGSKQSKSSNVYTLVFSNGQKIMATENHLIFTSDGWKAVKDIQQGNEVIVNEPTSNTTTDIRKSIGRCQHIQDKRKCKASLCPRYQTKGLSDFKTFNTQRLDASGAEGLCKWRMGIGCSQVRHNDTSIISRCLESLHERWQVFNINAMAKSCSGRGISMVVPRRWKQDQSWSSIIDRIIFLSRSGNYEAVVPRKMESFMLNTPFKKKLVSSKFQQGERSQVFSNCGTIHAPYSPIQTLFAGGACLQMLSTKLFAKSKRAILLLKTRVQNRELSKSKSFILPATQRGNTGKQKSTNTYKNLFYLQSGVPNNSHKNTLLQVERMQENTTKTKGSQALSTSPCIKTGICTVTEIIKEEQTFDVYDIAVSNTHCYFANGILVHNCHHATAGSYRRCIEWYSQNPNLKILGVTATPDRSDEEALGQVFESVAYDYEVMDAIQDGWLVPVKQQMVSVGHMDLSNIHTTAGDLNQGELSEVLENEQTLHEIAHPTTEICGDRRAIVFAATVKQAERLCEIFNRIKPNSSAWVCGKTDKEVRKKILADFKAGKTQYVCNVGVLTEGFDDDGVEVIVMARPTKSRSLYAQMAGRGTRPHSTVAHELGKMGLPEDRRNAIKDSPKPSATIIDFVGNSGKHKLCSSADILGGKYTEEEVQRATDRAKASSEPVDMTEELEKARKAIQDEKMRQAARRAAIVCRTKYSVTEINPFDVFDIVPAVARGWDRCKQLSAKQKEMLEKQGIKTEGLSYTHGKQLLDEIFRRWKNKMPSLKQQKVLNKAGFTAPMRPAETKKVMEKLAQRWK